MKKLRVLLVITIACAVLFTACAQSVSTSTEPTEGVAQVATQEADKKPYIVFVTPLLGNELFLEAKRGYEDAAAEYGFDTLWVGSDSVDMDVMVQQIETCIAEKVDGIISCPVNPSAFEPVYEKAKEAGIPIVNMCVDSAEDTRLSYVGTDHKAFGEAAAKALAEKMGGNAKIAIMQGPMDAANTNAQIEAFTNYCTKNYPDMEIVVREGCKEKKVLLTGGSRGIGYAIAKKLISEDAQVLITGRHEEKMKKACVDLGIKNINYMVWDVGNIEHLQKNLTLAIETLGGIDVLINNAGVLTDGDFVGMFEVTPETWDYTMNVNLKGVFFMCQAVSEYMINNKIKGRIVNICSNCAFRSLDTAYAISKWGIRGLTMGMGRVLAPYGIIVNGVAPGCTSTTMIKVQDNEKTVFEESPIGRYSYPSEIADVVAFLSSDNAGSIVGQIVLSDGGETLIK